MCVIAIAVQKKLTLETLLACEDANPHGGGVAWVEGNTVHFKKNINAQQAFDLVADKPLPHVFHFRIASVGGVIPALCHPFPIRSRGNNELEGTTSAAFFHNGTVHNWRFLAKLAGVTYPEFASDSLVVARIAALRGKKILEEIQGGKFCILNADRSINLYGDFSEKDGYLYSNLYWQQSRHAAAASHRRFQACGDDDCGTTESADLHRNLSAADRAAAQRELELERGGRGYDKYDAYVSNAKPNGGIPGTTPKKTWPVRDVGHIRVGGGGIVETPGDRDND